MKPWTIYQGDCRAVLASLPEESVHCVVTSPPYWGLRDYGTATWEGGDPGCDHRPVRDEVKAVASSSLQGGKATTGHLQGGYPSSCLRCGAVRIDDQIGLEASPAEFVAEMVAVFREVRRVLRSDGSLWLNLGDSYASDIKGSGGTNPQVGGGKRTILEGQNFGSRRIQHGLKPKDLCGIPWRVALALQQDGWWLRSDIIWAKNNPMPASVTDRPTTSHEYIFLLTKRATYYYDQDAIREITGREADPEFYAAEKARNSGWTGPDTTEAMARQPAAAHGNFSHPAGRNKRTVWKIPTEPYSGAHFATYPTRLVEPCVQAGTSQRGCCAACGAPWERVVERERPPVEQTDRQKHLTAAQNFRTGGIHTGDGTSTTFGLSVDEMPRVATLGWRPTCPSSCPGHRQEPVPCVVLDPFCGSGTTGEVALALGRRFIGIELNPSYIALAEQRLTLLPSYTGRRKAAPKTDAGQLSILEEVA